MNKSFKQIESRVLRHVRSMRDKDDINAVMLAVKTARARIDRDAADTFSVGQNVMVVQKTKSTPGIIVKVNRTRCVVKMNGSRYNVPNSMISTNLEEILGLTKTSLFC